MDLVYLRVTEAHKRATETTVPTETKYSKTQLLHLTAFFGLELTKQHLLPDIWKNLQKTKDWYDAGRELSKWFRTHRSFGDIPYQFHKELVDDIRKLIFSTGAAILADNVRRGINPLVFVLVLVADENKF